MLFGSRIFALAASLTMGLGIAASSNALSLADLVVPGASFSVGNGATFSNFVVKIKGKGLSEDLSLYEILPTDDGFALVGDFSESRKGGKIKLSYDVAGSALVSASLAIGIDNGADGLLKVKEKIFDEKKLGKLRVSTRSGEATDDLRFGGLDALQVASKIKIRGDHFLSGSGASIENSLIASAPEPTTALMLAGGLAGLAAARRRLRP
jgi:hypothetical protein